MSHKATNWLSDLAPTLLGNAEFRVLFHLCDCHNPARGCFPTQAYLLDACGVSNGTLNNALNSLEEKGLIQRHKERDGKTRRQKPTHYILGFEIDRSQGPTPETGDGKPPKPTPETGDGSDSNFNPEPTPISSQSRLQPTGEVTCKGTSKEPVTPLYSPQIDLLGEAAEKPPPRKRAVSLPDGWVPSAKNVEDARKENFTDEEIRNEAQQFRDHHHARGTTFKCWDAAWRTWLRNARKFGCKTARRSSGSQAHANLISGFARALDQLD